ncbi:MAG TPA: hypothetical protein DER56_00405, partial [Thermosipho africanus]|nr:hypothetical protein [Thermosipho africanus]
FRLVLMPLLTEAVAASYLKIFSSTMTTLGAIIFLILPKNKVAVQVIFQSITHYAIGVPATLALLLSFVTLVLMGVFYVILNRKSITDKFMGVIQHEN